MTWSDPRITSGRLHEKGDHGRTIGLHYAAAQAIREYLEKAGLLDWISALLRSGVSLDKLEAHIPFVGALLKKDRTSTR